MPSPACPVTPPFPPQLLRNDRGTGPSPCGQPGAVSERCARLFSVSCYFYGFVFGYAIPPPPLITHSSPPPSLVRLFTGFRATGRDNCRVNGRSMGGVMLFLLRDVSCLYLLTNTIIPILFSKQFTRKRRFKSGGARAETDEKEDRRRAVAAGRQVVSTPRRPFSFSSSPFFNPPLRRRRCPPQRLLRDPRRRGVRLGGTGHGEGDRWKRRTGDGQSQRDDRR